MDGVPKSFDRVVCDGSHGGSTRPGRDLTKAEEDLTSRETVHGSVYCDLGPNGGLSVGRAYSAVFCPPLSHQLQPSRPLKVQTTSICPMQQSCLHQEAMHMMIGTAGQPGTWPSIPAFFICNKTLSLCQHEL